ncbi:MAG: U32 family peptidase [Alphaproteobacteria bacterium]
MKLTLGPLLFNWPATKRRDFYFGIADEAPVDVVYLGEVVCSKRTPLFEAYLSEVAERLVRAGKEVIVSTLALIMSEREMEAVRAIAEGSRYLVEANDMACAAMLAGRPHAVGPFVNVYNEATLGYLARNGAIRMTLPAELPAPALAVLARAADGVELEVQAFGRLPLAISARCYHARVNDLHKDSCRYVCADHPDGMPIETLDNEPFLAVNGTQTMSHALCSLIRELDDLVDAGLNCFRLWPHAIDMIAVTETFRDVLDHRRSAEEAEARLGDLVTFAPFSNGFYYGREGAARIAASPFAGRGDGLA